MKRIKSLAVVALSVALLAANAGRAFAANSTSITLSSASAQVGNNLTIFINENSGSTTINLVTVGISYDSSKLQFVEFNDSGSEFDYKGAQSAAGGSASVKRGLYGGAYTGGHRVTGITFKALAAGSASVSVNSATVTNPQAPTDVEWNGVKNSTTATIASAPASTGGSTSTGSTSGGSSSSSSSSTKSTASTKTATTATPTTGSTSNSSSAASDGSDATSTTTPEVKGDSTTKKSDDKKSDDTKKTDDKKSSNKVLPIFIFILLGVAAFFGGRYAARYMAARKAKATEAEVAKTEEKPKAKKTSKK